MLSKSRRKKYSARELWTAEMTCGKSMIVGPSAAARMLYGDRSPWMRSQHSIEIICATQVGVDADRRIALDRDVDQPRRGPALGVAHEVHEQHALVEHHGLRHADPAAHELVERVRLGGLPRLLGGVAPEPAAAVDRALGAAVADLAALLVVRVVLEAARRAVLVDLRGDARRRRAGPARCSPPCRS